MLTLYHTGFQVIREPDIRCGRKNADFGQGFYLSDSLDFARRWARQRKGETTYVNAYALDTAGLRVHRLDRDEAWFDYIFANRGGRADALADADVIIGPIANGTLYDTWGILTSGLLPKELCLRLLQLGNAYTQVVIKTDAARARLRWLSAQALTEEEMRVGRETVHREEEAFQTQFRDLMGEHMRLIE